MSARKPLADECTGSILCPVPGHNVARRTAKGVRLSHIPLTKGQYKTLHERHRAERNTARAEQDSAS